MRRPKIGARIAATLHAVFAAFDVLTDLASGEGADLLQRDDGSPVTADDLATARAYVARLHQWAQRAGERRHE